MSIEPLVTVAIAVYNAEKYLKDCMESVVNQTYKNLEIICVNDASTDSSLAILEPYAAKDNRVKIITNKTNSGLGVTRNVGLDAAQGEYILFVDSDDWIDLTTCEKLVTKAQENDADIVFYSALRVDGKQRSMMSNYCEVSSPLTLEDRRLLLRKAMPSTWSKLWKRNFMVYNKIRFPDARRAQDHAPHWMGCILAKKIKFLNKENGLYFYRIHSDQISQSSDKKLIEVIYSFQKIENFLIEKNIKDFDLILLEKKLNSILYNYTKINKNIRKLFKNKFTLSKKEKKFIFSRISSSSIKIYYLAFLFDFFLFFINIKRFFKKKI